MQKRTLYARQKRKARRLAPYRRLEQELQNTRDALGTAATRYTEALQALIETLAMLDASSFQGGASYRCLTPAELTRLDQIRTWIQLELGLRRK